MNNDAPNNNPQDYVGNFVILQNDHCVWVEEYDDGQFLGSDHDGGQHYFTAAYVKAVVK